jgi:DDE superfamily endonuclease
LSFIFFNVTDFLNQIAGTIIKFPNSQEKGRIKSAFEAKTRLKEVIGAVDGCYIPMKAPAAFRSDYVNRKFFTSVTLQAICDDRMRYLDCFIGFPSSVHDNRIFKNSPFYKSVMENKHNFFQDDEKILGDKAYPVENWCIPPFIDRGRLTDNQKRFNTSFALLFGRFRRLRDVNMNRSEYVPVLILAACVLHNLCIDFQDVNLNQYLVEGTPYANINVLTDAETTTENINVLSRNGVAERNHMVQQLCSRRNI